MSLEVFSIDSNGLHCPFWGPYVSSIENNLCPYIIGGDGLDLKPVISLHPAHLSQTDKTKNRALWDLFPVSSIGKEGMTEYGDAKELVHRKRLSVAYNAHTPAHVKLLNTGLHHEHVRIYGNISTLHFIYEKLKKLGYLEKPVAEEYRDAALELRHATAEYRNSLDNIKMPPSRIVEDGLAPHPATRKASNTIEPLEPLIKRLTEHKDIAWEHLYRTAEYLPALVQFYSLLTQLYPWTATPLLFKHEQAFTLGLAQLESDLWVKLGMTCLRVARLTKDMSWYVSAQDCSEAIVNLRYATYGAQCQAWFTYYECSMERYRDDPRPLTAYGHLLTCPPIIGVGAYIMGHALRLCIEDDPTRRDKWVHRECRTGHVCGLEREREAQQLRTTRTPNTVTCPNGINGVFVLNTDYEMNDKY